MRPESRPDPILPVAVSVREHPAREAGRLAFGGIVDLDQDLPADGQLPLLPAPEGPRVRLLELVDRYGVPTMAQGRGAPLELAVYIGACILTPHRVRVSRGRLVTTVRELRDFLFGPTWRPGPTGNRPGDWERVRAAALNASDLWLPLENGDLWRAVAVRKIPPADYRPEYLDRQVIFDVELPDGAAHGPVIDRLELARLRLVSGPKFRAYIAAHSVAWRPGVTRRRHPRNRSVHLWSSDPAHYPVLTAEARRRLAFGSEDKKNRTRADQDAAWEDLAGVEILTRTATTQDGRRGWLIVPEAAAAAIRAPTQPENLTYATGESECSSNHRSPRPRRSRNPSGPHCLLGPARYWRALRLDGSRLCDARSRERPRSGKAKPSLRRAKASSRPRRPRSESVREDISSQS